MDQKIVFQVRKLLSYFVLIIILIIILFPIYWIVSSSLKYKKDLLTSTPKFVFKPTLSNYVRVLGRGRFTDGLINSLIVVPLSLFIGIVLGVPAAYALARLHFKYKNSLKFWILSMRFLPPVAVIIPLYMIWLAVKLLDTYFALILTYSLVSLPIIILLMSEYFLSIPVEMEEAALVDGGSRFQVFYKITLPNVTPALLSTLTFSFMMLWNEFFLAFILMQEKVTLPVAVAAFAAIGVEIPWAEVCASASLLMFPPLILVALFRRALVSFFLSV
jgi:multiple sugar transport system permease protein